MNMKHARHLLVGLLAVSAFAQEAKPKPIYFGATYVLNEGDLRKYAGGKAMSYAFEAGYEIIPSDEGIGANIYARYMRTFGDRRFGSDFPAGGVKLALDTWSGGLDLTFATPIRGLVPYAGVNLNYFDGSKSDAFQVPKYSFEDSKAKVGVRLGVQYRFNSTWSATADYNFAEWRSARTEARVPGVNPMNPSWIGVTVRYNFSY